MTVVAIALAVAAAFCLAYGAHYQHDAVSKGPDHGGGTRLNRARFVALLRTPRWILGLAITGLGVVLNVGALALAPVMVVQPVGALSLIVSVLLGMHYRKLKLRKRLGFAVALCTVGVVGFVTASALTARSSVRLGADAHPMAIITSIAIVIFLIMALVWRHPPQLPQIIAAGLLFACVATSVHMVSMQFLHSGFASVNWFNVGTLVAASALGAWYVQSAYASGPPELVIAGLTVIDPIVAVLLGAIVLGEAAGAPLAVIFAISVAGAMACAGVWVLSKYHPDVLDRDEISRLNEDATTR